MTLYHYCKNTGEYKYQTEARRDPKVKGSFLVPKYSTPIVVPSVSDNEIAVFAEGKWKVSPDNRGTTYWVDHKTSVTISIIGETVPENAYLEQPKEPLHEVKRSKIDMMKDCCNRDIVKGFVSNAVGKDYIYQSDIYDQINLMGHVLGEEPVELECFDGDEWVLFEHDQEQLKNVLKDMNKTKSLYVKKYKHLKQLISDAENLEDVESIEWEN